MSGRRRMFPGGVVIDPVKNAYNAAMRALPVFGEVPPALKLGIARQLIFAATRNYSQALIALEMQKSLLTSPAAALYLIREFLINLPSMKATVYPSLWKMLNIPAQYTPSLFKTIPEAITKRDMAFITATYLLQSSDQQADEQMRDDMHFEALRGLIYATSLGYHPAIRLLEEHKTSIDQDDETKDRFNELCEKSLSAGRQRIAIRFGVERIASPELPETIVENPEKEESNSTYVFKPYTA